MRMSYTLCLLSTLMLTGCAHFSGLTPRSTATTDTLEDSAPKRIRPDQGGLDGWRLGMTPEQVQKHSCTGGYYPAPILSGSLVAEKSFFCMGFMGLDETSHPVFFSFGKDNRLQRIGIQFGGAWEQAAQRLVAYMQDEWGELQLKDGSPIPPMALLHQKAAQAPLRLYPKRLPTGSSGHHMAGLLDSEAVSLSLT